MSEFYFDYKCIAMNAAQNGSQKDPNKALDFYLHQNYGSESGDMCVQIYIPKDIQKRYCGAKLYFKPNSAEFPDMFDGSVVPELFEIAARDSGNYPNISKDNCVMIDAAAGLSGCGILAFIDGTKVDAPPKAENAYKFVINYTKKETISYCIEEKKNGLNVRIIYPLIRAPITLGVLRKKGAKPVLISERSDINNFLTDKKGEPVIITLKPTGRKSSSVTINLGAEATNEYDFRLVFEDPENNKYYMLVDESEYTIEDRDVRKRALAFKREEVKTNKAQRRCPFCGRPLRPAAVDKSKCSTSISDCQGNVITYSTSDPKLIGKHTVVCSEDIIGLSEGKGKLNRAGDAVDYLSFTSAADRVIIPPSSFDVPSMNVVVAGFPRSGKTMYLASIMNMERHGDKAETNPIILHKILNKFDGAGRNRAEKLAGEVKFDCVRIKYSNGDFTTEYVYDYEDKRSSVRDADGKIKMRYAMTVGNNVESYTSPMDATRLAYNPIGYQLGGLGNVYFYDVPGELFRDPQPMRAVDVADCFIAVIDGDPKSDGDPIENVRNALDNIERLSTETVDLENMPIAIVFTKHDKKLSDYIPKQSAARALCFDENCHVVREDILGLIKGDGHARYEDSALERHIDCSSYELEHYLKARNPEEFKKIITRYKNIKFFTCSALGNDVCLKEKDGYTKEVLFKPRRIRVELPLIWLMYQKGLIKR